MTLSDMLLMAGRGSSNFFPADLRNYAGTISVGSATPPSHGWGTASIKFFGTDTAKKHKVLDGGNKPRTEFQKL